VHTQAAAQAQPGVPSVGSIQVQAFRLGTVRTLLAALVLAVLGGGAYFGFRASAGSEEAEVRRVYAAFHQAILDGDAAQLKSLTTADKLAELNADDAEEKLELASELYPEKATVQKVVISGEKAVLTANAQMMEETATGRIDLIKESSGWKVSNAEWTMNFSAESEAEAEPRKPPRNVPRPADFPQLIGTWKGEEVGGGAQWTLTFTRDYRLEARSPSGESYGGEAMIRWDLGIENNRIHMPAGWAPMDIEIDEASHDEAIGKVAMSAFSLHSPELKLCGGPPGYGKRVKSFESPGSPFRCMVLTKTADGEPLEQGPAEESPSEAPAPSDIDEEGIGPGEATLLLDGVAQRYRLRTGFFSDTKLEDPKNATLHFEHPAPKHSNARRIILMLDATHTGRHYADGQAIHDSMFNDKPVKIGDTEGGALAAILKWQADGGQVYPPKIGTRCEIRVVSPYTGATDSEFIAEIEQCPIHSAGIDKKLSNVKLSIKGPVAAK